MIKQGRETRGKNYNFVSSFILSNCGVGKLLHNLQIVYKELNLVELVAPVRILKKECINILIM